MRNITIITVLFVLITTSSMAQWVGQATAFANEFMGLNSISVVDGNVVWATAYDGNAIDNRIQQYTITTDGGDSWTAGEINVGSTAVTISQISAVNKDTAWIAVAPNPPTNIKGIFITINGGQDWTRQSTANFNSTNTFPNLVHFWDKNNGFCQGDPIGPNDNRVFELYTTTDGGNTWIAVEGENIPAPLYGEWGYTSLSSVTGNSIWFGTNAGRIYHSADKGYTWSVAQAPITDFGGAVNGAFAFKDETNGLLIDNNSKLWETSDAGMTWDEITTATGNHYSTDITAVPGALGTYINTGKGDVSGEEVIGGGISYSNDNGYTWIDFSDQIQLTEKAEWISPTIGWVGTFNIDAVTGGIYKYNGSLTSISSKIETSEFNIYPNPASTYLNIKNTVNGTLENIKILDVTGKIILEVSNYNNYSHSIRIDISQLNRGIYFIKIGNSTKKFIHS